MTIPILTYGEHVGYKKSEEIDSKYYPLFKDSEYSRKFKKIHKGKNKNITCFEVKKVGNEDSIHTIESNYLIGVDWIIEDKLAINIQPKINTDTEQVDYLKMLLSAINHPEVMDHLDELFEVHWNEPKIPIEQQNDFLTPFLILEFLGLLKQIAKKGIRKSYYKVEENLYSRVKGKILVGKTIKHNISKNKKLNTYCSYQEFGVDTYENRILKKALQFAKIYLPTYEKLMDGKGLQDLYNFINPAFENVSDNVDVRRIKNFKNNRFFKEYDKALHLAQLIFDRFGYNISSVADRKIETPPFWIDMSRLFELYILGQLKDIFGSEVKFQFSPDGNNNLDYLLNSRDYKMVIDAKYKPKYIKREGKEEKDLRQVSGYARLKKVHEELYGNEDYNKIIDCLIIYPDQESNNEVLTINDLTPIESYINMYKLGIRLPILKSTIL